MKLVNKQLSDVSSKQRAQAATEPALTQEFVALYNSFAERWAGAQAAAERADLIHQRLQDEGAKARAKAEALAADKKELEVEHAELAGRYKDMAVKVNRLGGTVPLAMASALRLQAKRGHAPGTASIRTCGHCDSTEAPDLMAKCDVCKKSFHIHCLDPPLKALPKTSKNKGWMCSNCDPSSSEEELEVQSTVIVDGRRLSRRQRKSTVAYEARAGFRRTDATPAATTPSPSKKASKRRATNAKHSSNGDLGSTKSGKKKRSEAPAPSEDTAQSRQQQHASEAVRVAPGTVRITGASGRNTLINGAYVETGQADGRKVFSRCDEHADGEWWCFRAACVKHTVSLRATLDVDPVPAADINPCCVT